MACAVQSMAPQMGQQQSNQPGKYCGVAGLPAAKEPDKPADQVRRVRSPMRQDTCSVVCNLSSGDWLEVLNQSQKSHHLYVRSATLSGTFGQIGARTLSLRPSGSLVCDRTLMSLSTSYRALSLRRGLARRTQGTMQVRRQARATQRQWSCMARQQDIKTLHQRQQTRRGSPGVVCLAREKSTRRHPEARMANPASCLDRKGALLALAARAWTPSFATTTTTMSSSPAISARCAPFHPEDFWNESRAL